MAGGPEKAGSIFRLEADRIITSRNFSIHKNAEGAPFIASSAMSGSWVSAPNFQLSTLNSRPPHGFPVAMQRGEGHACVRTTRSRAVSDTRHGSRSRATLCSTRLSPLSFALTQLQIPKDFYALQLLQNLHLQKQGVSSLCQMVFEPFPNNAPPFSSGDVQPTDG
jgi:hypothetical protein